MSDNLMAEIMAKAADASPLPDHAEEFIQTIKSHTKVDEHGRVLVTDDRGLCRFHAHKPGCPEMTPDDLIAELRHRRAEWFAASPT